MLAKTYKSDSILFENLSVQGNLLLLLLSALYHSVCCSFLICAWSCCLVFWLWSAWFVSVLFSWFWGSNWVLFVISCFCLADLVLCVGVLQLCSVSRCLGSCLAMALVVFDSWSINNTCWFIKKKKKKLQQMRIKNLKLYKHCYLKYIKQMPNPCIWNVRIKVKRCHWFFINNEDWPKSKWEV